MPDMLRKSVPWALWVIPVADLAGVARHVMDVMEAGIPGWQTMVLCPEGPLAARLRAMGAAVVTAPFGPRAGVLESRRSLARIASAVEPAIVHSHLAFADIITAWTPLPKKSLRFTTEHGIAGEDSVYHGSRLRSQLMAALHRARLRRFDGVIAVSQATKRTMIENWGAGQDIAVIRNGVDASADARTSARRNSSTLRILSLSRLAPEKRIDKLLEAFVLVRAAMPDATLTVAGEGPSRDGLMELADTLGIGDAVAFPGFLDHEKAMGEADVIAQLSVWENCSYTLLEAAARGIPVVASDVGGNSEVVAYGELVSPEDVGSVCNALLMPKRKRSVEISTVRTMVEAIAEQYRIG